MIKKFLNIDEQIQLLKERNLSFNVDGNDISKKIKWYLSKYNYQNFINGYNDPFMVNFDRNKNWYRDEVNAQHIIELFNFDRKLSSILIGDILSIERTFCTKICYHVLKKYKDNSPKINEGKILKLSTEEFLNIFSNVENVNFDNDLNVKNEINVKIDVLKKKIIGHSRGKQPSKKYKINDELPLWILSIYWSFGDACKIFSSLNNELKKEIVLSFFDNKIKWFSGFDDSFLSIMCIFNNLRNTICHGNVIYSFKNYKNLDYINKFVMNTVNNKITIKKHL